MELGSHLAAKLEPFVLMSKSAKGAAAAKLILDVTSAQGVFFFAELLDAPNIKQVRFERLVPNYLTRLEPVRLMLLLWPPISSRAANNTERIMHCWRYSRTERIRITSVRSSIILSFARCTEPDYPSGIKNKRWYCQKSLKYK